MTTNGDFHCLAQGPVIELLMTASKHADGWECRIRHRHPGGKLTDCQDELYFKLDDGELSQVLEASSWSLSARSPSW